MTRRLGSSVPSWTWGPVVIGSSLRPSEETAFPLGLLRERPSLPLLYGDIRQPALRGPLPVEVALGQLFGGWT